MSFLDRLGARCVRAQAPIVWAGWGLMTVMAAALVWRFGLPIPFADGWSFSHVATGFVEPDVQWLWAPHNEHRLPLPKLVYWIAGEATGYDFRLMALVNVFVLSATAAVWIATMRRLRGATTMVDLLVPAALLHWGHELNLTWCFNFCLTTLLATTALLIIASARQPLAARTACGLAVVLFLLAGCGSVGLVYLLPLATWIGICAVSSFRGGERQVESGVAVATCAAALAAVFAAYCLSFPDDPHAALHSPGLGLTLVAALRFAVTSIGPLGRGIEPAASIAFFAWVAGAGAILARACWRRAQSRMTIAGLGLFMAAGVGLALVTARARAGGGLDHLEQTRYAIHALPLFCCLVLVWERFGGARAQRGLMWTALVMIPALIVVNDRKGYFDARDRRASIARVEALIGGGASPQAIAAQWSEYLQCHPEALAFCLDRLDARGLGPYAKKAATAAVLADERGHVAGSGLR